MHRADRFVPINIIKSQRFVDKYMVGHAWVRT